MLDLDKKEVGVIMTNLTWQELYKSALLELRPEQLRLRIEAAESAIHLRLQELQNGDDASNAEHHAMADALRGLRTLSNSECKPANHPVNDARSLNEAAS
jgi:hypothetical protein